MISQLGEIIAEKLAKRLVAGGDLHTAAVAAAETEFEKLWNSFCAKLEDRAYVAELASRSHEAAKKPSKKKLPPPPTTAPAPTDSPAPAENQAAEGGSVW